MPAKASKWLPDDLRERIQPLLPKPPRRHRRYPGRKRIDDRKVLTGIIFVLRTGIPWREMPTELGCGSGMTCLRRLKQWHRKGAFQKLYEVLLAELNGADKLDWSPALVDSATTKAPSGGEKTGSNPTDRGYDSELHRDQLRSRGIEPQLAKRRTEHGSGLGKTRWYVERTLAWFKRYGKIRIRTERRAENYEAPVKLAACLICYRNLWGHFVTRSKPETDRVEKRPALTEVSAGFVFSGS